MAELTEKDRLIGQLTFTWDYLFWPNVESLSDDEYWWEPVDNVWTIRQQDDGGVKLDWEWVDAKVDPVTTIAWLVNHMIWFFEDRYMKHFEDTFLEMEDMTIPMTAKEALSSLQVAYTRWVTALEAAPEERYDQPCGRAEKYYPEEPFAVLVLHINREFIYHAAELNLLMDLYRNSQM